MVFLHFLSAHSFANNVKTIIRILALETICTIKLVMWNDIQAVFMRGKRKTVYQVATFPW